MFSAVLLFATRSKSLMLSPLSNPIWNSILYQQKQIKSYCEILCRWIHVFHCSSWRAYSQGTITSKHQARGIYSTCPLIRKVPTVHGSSCVTPVSKWCVVISPMRFDNYHDNELADSITVAWNYKYSSLSFGSTKPPELLSYFELNILHISHN